MNRSIFVCLLGMIFLVAAGDASAEDSGAKDKRQIIAPSAPFTATLGGRKLGELYIGSKLTVKETRGDWSKVVAEGWIRNRDMSEPKQVQQSTASVANTVAQNVLEVVDYIAAHRTDIDPPRMYLTLTVKNVTNESINNWSGTLVAQDAKGKVLFREPLSQDQASIAPKSQTEVSFYWEPEEEPYDVLYSQEKGNLELGLAAVSINKEK